MSYHQRAAARGRVSADGPVPTLRRKAPPLRDRIQYKLMDYGAFPWLAAAAIAIVYGLLCLLQNYPGRLNEGG